MDNNNIITIGTALKWRGIFNKEKTYYQDNIVVDSGCIFRCKVLQTKNQPPVKTNDEDGHFEFINQDIWDVVLDMSIYYDNLADIGEELISVHDAVKTKADSKHTHDISDISGISTMTDEDVKMAVEMAFK